jgi:hypothetical protein
MTTCGAFPDETGGVATRAAPCLRGMAGRATRSLPSSLEAVAGPASLFQPANPGDPTTRAGSQGTEGATRDYALAASTRIVARSVADLGRKTPSWPSRPSFLLRLGVPV